MQKAIRFFFFSLALTSCQISGLTSGYSHLSKQEQARVIKYKGNIAEIQDYSKIYAITPEQVKTYLSVHNKVIVYDYTPWCKSKYCVSPTLLANQCKANKVDLLVISNVYDDVFRAVNESFPLLIIDTAALKTKWRGKYIEKFYFSLIGKYQKDINYAGYHYFQNGNYIKSFKDFKDIGRYLINEDVSK